MSTFCQSAISALLLFHFFYYKTNYIETENETQNTDCEWANSITFGFFVFDLKKNIIDKYKLIL